MTAQQPDLAPAVHEVMAAHGISASVDEIAAYAAVLPVLRAMTEQLYHVQIDAEL